jgi:hypothetical protein
MEKNIKVDKRKFNNNRRQNYLQQQQRAILSLSPKEKRQALGALFVTFIIFLLFILKRTDQSANSQKKLRDQLSYISHNRTCTATLCNPLNRCSTWSANQIYDWSTLSQAGLFRDLATAQVSLGCELRIKVEDRVRGGEWLSLYDGFTECSDSGYGRKCRNLVEIDLKGWWMICMVLNILDPYLL